MNQQPNILILHADQLRYDGLGCDGNPHARTPHIDAIAAEGSVFTRHNGDVGWWKEQRQITSRRGPSGTSPRTAP